MAAGSVGVQPVHSRPYGENRERSGNGVGHDAATLMLEHLLERCKPNRVEETAGNEAQREAEHQR